MFDNCSNIIDKMNNAGMARTPFLFGIDYELSDGFFVANPLQQNDILFTINNVGNCTTSPNKISGYAFDSIPESFESYQAKFDIVMSSLINRDVDLINLTLKTPITTSLSLTDIFNHSKAKYRICIPNKFVCFSPEIFIRTHKGKIYSYPMKGTINASIPNAEAKIINNPKEIEEHTLAVKIIENDLSNIATNVSTTRFRYVDTIYNSKGNLLQVSSQVEGTLSDDFSHHLGTNIFKLLPAGSIAGWPRDKALEVIKQAEVEMRGYYSGIVGYFDGTDIDCGVMIRFIEKDGEKLYFRSGGGITINSNCESEYKEVSEKIYLPF